MCGITGVYAFNLVGKFSKINVAAATASLAHRGPDFHHVYTDEWICLGHRRLSVIDTREIANQPMWDESGRYCIVHNGEIFNYRELRQGLVDKGHSFITESDTEVLLKLFIEEKENCLGNLNGFFAFCIYDKIDQSLFLARDRFGIKPLLYLFDEDKFLFGSEMKSIIAYGIEKEIDFSSLYMYLQVNYIPAPDTIFSRVKKLLPGHYLKVERTKLTISRYHDFPTAPQAGLAPLSYEQAKEQFVSLLEASVKRSLVSDVPLGAFLSGGINSSVVALIASKYKPDLNTFSFGFKDEKSLDETKYARLVADHCKTRHTVFTLSNAEMYAHLHNMLDSIDEPFADSSAIGVYILSRETRRHTTVALSGDGADELLGGYDRHVAFERALNPGWLDRFAIGAHRGSRERYWLSAGFAKGSKASKLLSAESRQKLQLQDYEARKNELLGTLPEQASMNDILMTDLNFALPNDILTKVDLMSMAHGLEVRVPFLDAAVVDFVTALPSSYKIDRNMGKKILRDSFRNILPSALYNRPKKGFEVPLHKWLRREMKRVIKEDLLSERFVREQGIFEYREVRKLKRSLFGLTPGDVHTRVWGLVVFQWWWKNYVS